MSIFCITETNFSRGRAAIRFNMATFLGLNSNSPLVKREEDSLSSHSNALG